MKATIGVWDSNNGSCIRTVANVEILPEGLRVGGLWIVSKAICARLGLNPQDVARGSHPEARLRMGMNEGGLEVLDAQKHRDRQQAIAAAVEAISPRAAAAARAERIDILRARAERAWEKGNAILWAELRAQADDLESGS